ncbi:Drug/Metabolite Transporter (DMT) Superfamily [Achlya hypogyna]|uniref:Drug/Metabolite Transporter (DMT) Superfamily n=1 Tax=Achlya hypogyna TaxID=1202772 RepID=A0A1V9Z8B1_ACHHY|nr:Drug/Metabolite Transporter (DMT) Superfamily [Achlya hypogyna]
MVWWNSAQVRRQAINAAYGQLISLLLVVTSIFTRYLGDAGASLPTFQTLFLYGGLTVTFLVYHVAYKRPSVNLPWWYWILFALVDVEGNYCVVLAFRGLSNFAVMGLVVHMTIPFVTFFSFLLLRKKYFVSHIIGCVLAIAGCTLIFLATTESGDYPDQVKSNCYALLGALGYAVSNLMNEYAVKRGGVDANIECLGKIGIWGLIISIIQFYCLEYDDYKAVEWTGAKIGYTFGYVLAMYVFYSVVSVFLRVTEALMFNLSMLTSDLYAALFIRWLFGNIVPTLYWPAWALEVVGIVLYSLREPIQLRRDDLNWWLNRALAAIGLCRTTAYVESPVVEPMANERPETPTKEAYISHA